MIRLLATCVSAANRAGHIIREVAQLGRLDVVDKSVHDYQTEADRRAQRCIVSTIASRFPNITIVAEEDLPPSEEDQSLKVNEVNEDVLKEQCPRDFSTVQEKDIVLWVDPLDGTNEFIKGLYECDCVDWDCREGKISRRWCISHFGAPPENALQPVVEQSGDW